MTAGLITIHPLCEKISDTIYKGYAAIRTVSSKLFTVFGMGKRLKHERDRATVRQNKRARKEKSKQSAKVSLVMDMVANQANIFAVADYSVRALELRKIKTILNSP